MGECAVCRKETVKTLFKKAVVPIYICSRHCLTKFHGHKAAIQETLDRSYERGYWLE